MKTIRKEIYYFKSIKEAEKIKDKLTGKEINFFGHTVKAEPRIVSYQLGYAVQYIKSGAYYPQPYI